MEEDEESDEEQEEKPEFRLFGKKPEANLKELAGRLGCKIVRDKDRLRLAKKNSKVRSLDTGDVDDSIYATQKSFKDRKALESYLLSKVNARHDEG